MLLIVSHFASLTRTVSAPQTLEARKTAKALFALHEALNEQAYGLRPFDK